jgi:hypothetical protein
LLKKRLHGRFYLLRLWKEEVILPEIASVRIFAEVEDIYGRYGLP